MQDMYPIPETAYSIQVIFHSCRMPSMPSNSMEISHIFSGPKEVMYGFTLHAS